MFIPWLPKGNGMHHSSIVFFCCDPGVGRQTESRRVPQWWCILCFFRAPQKGPEYWCCAKNVEKCRKIFLTLFDVFCPAQKISKSIGKCFGHFSTFFDVAPFGGFCLCVFLHHGNDPRKTHKQNFATHPVPGQSPKFVYVCVFLSLEKGQRPPNFIKKSVA